MTLSIALAVVSVGIGYYWFKNSASSAQAEQIKDQGTNSFKKLEQVSRQVSNVSDDVADINQSQKTMQALMTTRAYEVETALRPELLKKYPYGYAVFSAGGAFFSQELLRGDRNPLQIRMGPAKTLAISNDWIKVRTPGIVYNPSENIHMDVGSLGTTLERTNGAWNSLSRFLVGVNTNLNLNTNHHIAIEVIANHQDGVTLLVGIRESVTPPGLRLPRSRFGGSELRAAGP